MPHPWGAQGPGRGRPSPTPPPRDPTTGHRAASRRQGALPPHRSPPEAPEPVALETGHGGTLTRPGQGHRPLSSQRCRGEASLSRPRSPAPSLPRRLGFTAEASSQEGPCRPRPVAAPRTGCGLHAGRLPGRVGPPGCSAGRPGGVG